MAPTPLKAGSSPALEEGTAPAEFTLNLANFEGPFDLLLSLIARRKLDITEIALAEVTDEFLHYISALYQNGSDKALDRASEFLVTAATLLDLKAARLLPRGVVESTEDIALLEARDLLFARLLQYRAYREVSALLESRYAQESQRFSRSVALEPQFKKVLPELVFEISPQEFAKIAAGALAKNTDGAENKSPEPQPSLDHLHQPVTSIEAEEAHILARLANQQETNFSELIRGSGEFEVAVVRFLALLELFRRGIIDIWQDKPLGELSVRANKLEQQKEADHE